MSIKSKINDMRYRKIVEKTDMAELPLILYRLHKLYRGKYQLVDIGGDCMFRYGEINIANVSYLATYIHFLSIVNGVLKIEGNVSWPTVLLKHFKLYISINKNLYRCDLYDADLDLKLETGETYETRKVFEYQLKLEDDKDYDIHFVYDCNGIKSVSEKINAMRFSPIADVLESQYSRFETRILFIEKNSIICKRIIDGNDVNQREAAFRRALHQKYPEISKWAISLRDDYISAIKKKRKQIWLFMDRPERADDNAEVFFKYMQRHQEIDSYFILSEESPDFDRLSGIGKVIELYSSEHYLMALCADKIISSQCNGVVENPFWEKAEIFRDLYHKPKIIFLQHGVIKDDMSQTLNRFNTNFSGFITSTEAEYTSILSYPYFYSKKEVWKTGLPLFDELINNSQKIILIIPTWRQGFMHQEWDNDKYNMKWVLNTGFSQSKYFKKYYSLLHNKQLLEKCREYEYRIVFMPHPLLEPYAEAFTDLDHLLYWDSAKSYREAFAEGSILVTDYSSVAFEFAYLRKPILYYQFDKKEFYKTHTYKKGYYDYERDGLGPVVVKESDLVKQIINHIETGCRLKPNYAARIDELYNGLTNTCESIYKKIINVR